MLKTIVILPDGREISSGAGAVNAIQSCTWTECVNSARELTPGAACAAMVELQLFTPGGGLSVAAGDELRVYQEQDGLRHPLGIFIAEKPVRSSANTMRITAYDRISRLDRDLSDWLSSLSGWPYSLQALAAMVCQACEVELEDTQLPNGSHLVQAFSASGVTGRRLMQWIGQATGRFCRATPAGKLEFAWYTPVTDYTIGPTAKANAAQLDVFWDEKASALQLEDPGAEVTAAEGVLHITSANLTAAEDGGILNISAVGTVRQLFYYQAGLSFDDYTVAPIEKVQIGGTEDDVGTQWPPNIRGNTLRITGNPLLTAENAQFLQTVAQTLYEQLKTAAYTPCTVTIPATPRIRAGQILTVTDPGGRTFPIWVMTKKRAGQRDTIECTGSPSRDSVSAVNEQSYTALSGKVLELHTDVEGLRAENRAADGRAARLELTVDGIDAQVRRQSAEADALRSELTAVAQTANAVKISVQSIREDGVSKVKTDSSYTFDDTGLHIARGGEAMENLLDNTGMYVRRAGQVILQANSDGVAAADVRVRNYLCVGENARFEDYGSGRTACFYTGG